MYTQQTANEEQHPKYRASPDFGLTSWNWEIWRSAICLTSLWNYNYDLVMEIFMCQWVFKSIICRYPGRNLWKEKYLQIYIALVSSNTNINQYYFFLQAGIWLLLKRNIDTDNLQPVETPPTSNDGYFTFVIFFSQTSLYFCMFLLEPQVLQVYMDIRIFAKLRSCLIVLCIWSLERYSVHLTATT